MILCCLDYGCCLLKVLESQLVSTCLALIVGSIIIERMNFRRNSDREMAQLLMSKIEKYDEIACLYWGTFDDECPRGADNSSRDELAARLKAEYPFLVLSIDNIKLIHDKKQLKNSIQELYDAATDSDFEVSKIFTKDEIRRTLVRIAKASAKVKRELYYEMMS